MRGPVRCPQLAQPLAIARAQAGMRLAEPRCVRSLVIVALLASTASAEPLWEAELRLGYGLAMGTGGGTMSRRLTPLTIEAIGSIAVNEEPAVAAYGGVILEMLNRNSVGGVFGVQLRPAGSRLRLAAGGAWIYAPYTMWGATGSIGMCKGKSTMGLCAHLQLSSYFAGTDLPEGHTVTQVQLALGMVFGGS